MWTSLRAVGSQRRKAVERRAQIDRTQVDVQPQRLAQRQQAGFRPLGERHGIPLGSADGAEQDGVGGPASRERFGGEGFARRVDGASAERELGEVELVAEFRGAFFQHAHGGPHDFRADAVARQEDNFLILNGHGFVAGRRQIFLLALAVTHETSSRQPKAK